jgi:hypothetical protein
MLTRGKVITTADKEIIGTIHVPTDFTLDLDFGALILAPGKLRSITFTVADRTDKPAQADPATPSTHENVGLPAPDQNARAPRYFRQGSTIIVISQVGDRVTLYNLDTKKSRSLELSGSKDAPLQVTPIVGENLVALMLKGPKVTRIAIADTATGTWHSQDLRKPIDGEAMPIVAAGVAVYTIGRNIYAYGAESQRWDVVELPEGVRAGPVVGPGSVTLEDHGHIYSFTGNTGKWSHIDVRAIVDVIGAEKK